MADITKIICKIRDKYHARFTASQHKIKLILSTQEELAHQDIHLLVMQTENDLR